MPTLSERLAAASAGTPLADNRRTTSVAKPGQSKPTAENIRSLKFTASEVKAIGLYGDNSAEAHNKRVQLLSKDVGGWSRPLANGTQKSRAAKVGGVLGEVFVATVKGASEALAADPSLVQKAHEGGAGKEAEALVKFAQSDAAADAELGRIVREEEAMKARKRELAAVKRANLARAKLEGK